MQEWGNWKQKPNPFESAVIAGKEAELQVLLQENKKLRERIASLVVQVTKLRYSKKESATKQGTLAAPVERLCPGCNQTFEAVRGFQTYCSRICGQNFNREQKRIRQREEYQATKQMNTMVYPRTCLQCGTNFVTESPAKKHCTDVCRKRYAKLRDLERLRERRIARAIIKGAL